MIKEKYQENWYNPKNILNWSEEEFRDTICKMVNAKILTGENLTPFLNAFYLNESAQWHRDRLLNEELKEELTMTKPTIVNGVDVSECEYLEKNDYCKKAEWLDSDNIIHKNVCIRQSNCLYKKLQRKIQECEELKRKLEENKKINVEKRQ